MISDHQDRWWMLGTENNTWYRYDGQKWLVDTPPGRQSPQANGYAASHLSPRTESKVKTSGFWFKFVILSTVLSALGFAVAEVIGGFRLLVPNILNNDVPGAIIGLAMGISANCDAALHSSQLLFSPGVPLDGFRRWNKPP